MNMTFAAARSRSRAPLLTAGLGAVIALLGWIAAYPAAAQSSSAQLDISGHVIPGSCNVADVNETMPEIAAYAVPPFPGRDVAASRKTFQLQFRNCLAVTGATVTFGQSSDADPGNWQIFRNTAGGDDAASGVGLRLYDDATCTGTTLQPGQGRLELDGLGAANDFEVPLCVVYHTLPTHSGPLSGRHFTTQFMVTVDYR